MRLIRQITAALTGLTASFALLSPSIAKAECNSREQWELPAKFNAVEDSGFFVVFELSQSGDGEYKGTAHFNAGPDFREVKGSASARLDGPRLDITFQWGGTADRYEGTIDPGGSIAGLKTNPRAAEGAKDRVVFWKSKQKATCSLGPNMRAKARAALREHIYKDEKGVPIKKLGKAEALAPEPSPKPIKSLGKAATVIADADVYDAPGGSGNVVGMLRSGGKVGVRSWPCPDNWCDVSGDAIPGGKGWVYSGPDYESLKR